MYNSDTELLFPLRVIPTLRTARGGDWSTLVDSLAANDAVTVNHLGFALMMVRLDGCTACNADSFRAMRGCTQCAKQSIRRYKGSDSELLALYQQSCREVSSYLKVK
jgi:formate dehydrogenase maturation protein FdhE